MHLRPGSLTLKLCDPEIPYCPPSLSRLIYEMDRWVGESNQVMNVSHAFGVPHSGPPEVRGWALGGEVWREGAEAETKPRVLGMWDKTLGGKEARNEDTACVHPPCRLPGPASITWPICQHLERTGSR